jgi:hypothetical protein
LSQIKAKIIADSYSTVNGKRITTFELEYPRFIHSEIMTHRLFSRNAMSSRAVPIEKMIKQVQEDPAVPVHWGKNQSGMQAKEELSGYDLGTVKGYWKEAAENAADIASWMSSHGAHKQVVNRILEPFQLMKTVLTSTEFDNFFWLRKHEDAQPEIKELAERIYEQLEWNKLLTVELDAGDWHTPYYEAGYWLKESETPLEDALAISSSCCAQVSYRLLDDSIEKARKVYQRLVESTPVHASPFEHCASPMKEPQQTDKYLWEAGMTHMDKDGNMWSGNLKGFIQFRQLIEGNVCNDFKGH